MGGGDARVWELWVPGVGSQGLSFARGRTQDSDVVLVHAAPRRLRVEVRDDDGSVLARGDSLERTADTPMCRLTLRDGAVRRADVWPNSTDLGRPVLLMGGEVGILTAWWHSDDEREWRWSLEFYNHR